MNRYWFKPYRGKRYGFRGRPEPSSWEGWVFLLGWVAVIYPVSEFPSQILGMQNAIAALLVGGVLMVCWLLFLQLVLKQKTDWSIDHA